MQIVEAIADAHVLDAGGEAAYTLTAGRRYVVYDSEAGYGLRDGACKLITGLDRELPAYNGQPLGQERLILPFIGRRGDALIAASCLAALKERYPSVTIDIAASKAAREVLRLMPRLGELLPHPLESERVKDYAYYLSFEEVEAIPRGWRRSYADVFSDCLRTPHPSNLPRVTIPPDAVKRRALPPTERPRAAIHVQPGDSLRSYPHDLVEKVVHGLVDAEFEVYLIGTVIRPPPSERMGHPPTKEGWGGAVASTDHVHDLIGKTPTAGDLAALLVQMDALICGDSFPMHLAGLLNVPTVALFVTTDAVIGSDYSSVISVQSQADCSPCHIADGACPLGHGECIAHRHPSVSPESLVKRIRALALIPTTKTAILDACLHTDANP